MKLSLSAVLVAALFIPAFTGCAAEDASFASQESDVEEGAMPSCEYEGPGNAKYKEAVAAARTWTRSRCEVMQSEVYVLAQDAVELCPGVGPLIARSEWAGELRTALGPLEVAYLAGELGADDDLDADAVAAALGDGITLHTNGQGVYGAPWLYHLEGDRYQLEELVFDETGEEIPQRVITETGSFGVVRGEEGDLALWVEADAVDGEVPSSGFWTLGRTTDFDGSSFFTFTPMGEEPTEDGVAIGGTLYTVDINECSA